MRRELRHSTRLVGLTAIFLFLVSAASCGQAAPSPVSYAPSTATATSIASPTRPSGQLPAGQTPAGQPSSDHAGARQVTITLAKLHFTPDETLLATIHNGLSTAIWAADHQSGCTMLALQRLTSGAWSTASQCALEQPTKIIEIPTGATLQQYIRPSQQMDMSTGWPSGTYRLTLTYAVSQTGLGSSATAMSISSADFTIG